ncbi:glycosyltransferase family 2 protein [Verrucomicrobium spinosum]|uniref:glycosyltransferase family 2 protein n=1 Tax=Verrucomicrobium spinosum TaxID=2736 RepID=UPI0009466022|nr:glycosyltransferase family A protein [Verrucomicrobium spinosum]
MPSCEDLTVLILAHDRPHYLRSALESVRGQVLAGRLREVLVSDNGAKGLAAEVVGEFSDLPIRYLAAPQDTDFCRHAHFAISQVASPLLAFLHDDDWWHPGHVSCSIRALEANPEAAYVASASLWLEGERSVGPPFYFNFPILTELAGSDGVKPVLLDWKQVLMLSWIYTPYHLSSLVGKTQCFLNSLEVWQETNYLVDRAFFGIVATKEKMPVVFLPYPSVHVRLHESQVTREKAEIQKAGAVLTVKRLREQSEREGINLNELWSRHRAKLKPATKSLFDTLARECLTTADLVAMGCDLHAEARPWESPAADGARKQGDELKTRLQATRRELEKSQKTLASVVGAVQTYVQRLLGAADRSAKHPSRAAIELIGASGATALAEANHEKANALHLDAAEKGAHLLQRISPRWYRNWRTSSETVPGSCN